MDKEFVPLIESKELKALGYDGKCFRYLYTGDTGNNVDHILEVLPRHSSNFNTDSLCISLPLWQQAFTWFMDVHGLYVEPFVDDDKTFGFLVSYFLPDGRADMPIQRQFKTAIERDLACIQFLINTVKEGKHLYP